MFGFARKSDLRALQDNFDSLEHRYALLLEQWKEWRQQLRNAAARLERAEHRETPSPAANGGGETASQGNPHALALLAKGRR